MKWKRSSYDIHVTALQIISNSRSNVFLYPVEAQLSPYVIEVPLDQQRRWNGDVDGVAMSFATLFSSEKHVLLPRAQFDD